MLQPINNYIQSIDKDVLLYFFSALAQCAAGFAALVGVFAIFRLQANAERIGEAFLFARSWLRVGPNIPGADSLTSVMIKDTLTHIKNKERNGEHSELAGGILKQILDAEGLTKKLAYKVSKPLKDWALIFLLSLAALSFAGCLEGLPGFLVVVGFLTGTALALCRTKRFVQKCLSFDLKTTETVGKDS